MLSAIISLLTSASLATAELNKVTLSVESSNNTLDGHFLTALHEGAGISAIFLTSSPQQYIYNSTSNTVSYDITLAGQYYMTLAQYGGGLAAAVTGPPYALLEDGYLAINGSQNVFYACNSIPFDPYRYSESNIGVSVYGDDEKVPSDCQALKIKGEIGSAVVASSSAASDESSESASVTESSSSEEAESSSTEEVNTTEESSATEDVSSSTPASTTDDAVVADATSSDVSVSSNSTSSESVSATATPSNSDSSVSSYNSSSPTESRSSSSSSRSSSTRSSSTASSENAALSAGLGGGLIAGIAYFLL